MELILSRNAQKQYNRLPKQEQAKIKKKLLVLQQNPLIGKKLEGKLIGCRSLRAWPYRVIYKINDNEKRVEVNDILHRQAAYKNN